VGEGATNTNVFCNAPCSVTITAGSGSDLTDTKCNGVTLTGTDSQCPL
jgi:hypothetical protein